MDSPRSTTSRSGTVSDNTTRSLDTLRIRVNIYPRLNTLAEQAKQKQMEKAASTEGIASGIVRRKSEAQEQRIFGRRSSTIPRTPPAASLIPTIQARASNCNNRNFVQNFSNSSSSKLHNFVNNDTRSFSSNSHQQGVSRGDESDSREASRERRNDQQDSNHSRASREEEKAVTENITQISTRHPRRNISPYKGSSTYRQEPPQTQPKDASDDERMQKIQEALRRITEKMSKMDTRVSLQEKMQSDNMETLTALTTNQIAFRDQLQNITDRQDNRLQELNEKQEARWQQLNEKQEKGFEILTSLIQNMNVKNSAEQEKITITAGSQPLTRTTDTNTDTNTETPRSMDIISVIGTASERTTMEQGCNTSPRPQIVSWGTTPQSTNVFSQHKADKPEKFDGKVKNNALEKWIQLVENYATATRMGEKDLLLFAISNLKEQAADWWLASSITQREKGEQMTKFSEMKTAMRLYFADHATKCNAISKLRVLWEKTSVTGYTQEFLRLRLLCPEISEEIATQYYVEGLSADIRAYVALHKPKKVDEAVNFAVVAATAIRRGTNNTSERPRNFNDKRNKNKFKPNMSTTAENNNSYKQGQKRFTGKTTDEQRTKKTCHFCKEPGRLMAECRKKQAQEKNIVDRKQRPIRKNNMQPETDSDVLDDNFDNSDVDEDCTAVKVNCLAYAKKVPPPEAREITSAAYNSTRALPNELITLIAHINGRKARILVDSGAGGNFISEESAKIYRIRKSKMCKPIKIQYADKRKDDCTHEVKNAQITIGNYNAYLPLIVAPLAYDAILGKPWLTKENPEIDWTTNKVWVIKENTRIPLPIKNAQNITIRPMSLLRFQKETNEHGTRTFLITIYQEKEERTDPCATSTQPEMARKIMSDYPTVFCEEHPGGLPKQTEVQHTIELEKEEKPPCRPLQLMSPTELAELRKQLDAYLEKGWIKPSDSPYGAPVLFALKKDGSKRLCIDYRALNQITKKSKYPLPRFEELQAMIGKANLFSKIDLSNGYHQVRIAPEEMHKTAFRTRFGQFEWRVMPFGLMSAPATFQRLINNVLRPLQNKSAAGILDDILIFTTGTKEQHDGDVREVVELLKTHHLIAKPKKCSFFEEQVEYWGHVVTKSGWTTEKSKIQTIQNWPSPLPNVHAVRSFLGMCAYYRRYVKDFTLIALPLYELVRKEEEFLWTKECEKALATLKEKLTTAPILMVADHNKPFVVTTDASHYAIGAILQQHDDKGELRPIAFESRKLKVNRGAKTQDMGEVRYPTHEKEMLAIIHAAKVWRHLLLGNKVTFQTDHMPLKYLQKQASLSDRQTRWMQFLQQYDFEIIYKPGKDNVVADALSRRCDLAGVLHASDGYLEEMVKHYTTDRSTNEMLKHCKEGTEVYKQGNKIFIKDNILYVNKNGKILIWVPTGALRNVLEIVHEESGHPGKAKLSQLIRRKFWWPQMTAAINQTVRNCDKCQQAKATNQKPQGLLHPLPVAKGPWDRIAIDLITDLPVTNNGNDSILTVTNTFTKYVYILPTVKTATAKILADLLFENVLRLHGIPSTIVSDRDPRFLSDFWKHLWKRMETRLAMSTAFHPQSDGQSERTNRTVIQQLRMRVNDKQENWDIALPLIQLHMNNMVNVSTGFSPYFANFGTHPRLPPLTPEIHANKDLGKFLRERMEVKKTITQNLTSSQGKQKIAADKKRQPCNLETGQLVMLSTRNLRFRGPNKKLAPKFIGPFKITAVINRVTCKLLLPNTLPIHNTFHSSLLRIYTGNSTTAYIHPGFLAQGPIEEFEVEDILQQREEIKDGRKQRFFLLKWKNADVAHSTWEPEGNLANARRLLREYLKKAKQKDTRMAKKHEG